MNGYMSRKGINSFFPKRVKSQQLNLFEHFNIADIETFIFKNGGNSKQISEDDIQLSTVAM